MQITLLMWVVAGTITLFVFGSIWIEYRFKMWRSHREYNKEE